MCTSIDWLNDKRLVFTGFDSQAGAWSGVTGLWAVDIDGNDNRLLIDPYWWGFRAVQPTSRVILSADWAFFDTPKDGSDDVLVVRRGWPSLQSRVTYALSRLDTRQPRPHRLDENAPEGTDEYVGSRPRSMSQHDALAFFPVSSSKMRGITKQSFSNSVLAGWARGVMVPSRSPPW